VTARLATGIALLAALAVAAPIAVADPTPPGDQSPSYGGNPSGGDHTAPYLRATIRTRHLATIAKTGKLKLSLATSEKSVVALAGTLTVRAPHAKTLRLKLRGTTLLFKRSGQKGGTLTLSASGRHRLAALLRTGGNRSRGTFRLTGTGADAAHNKRHLKKSATLRR
jgi:hypothetical protein